MRIRRIFSLVSLLLLCLLFLSGALFAQDIDPLKSEIYSKLKCCDCGVSFDKCACPEAGEMKAFIEALLGNSALKEDIYYRIANKFSLEVILDQEIKNAVKERLIKEAGQKRPQIILEPATFNFGKVSKRQGRASKIFRLDNKGNSDLVITNIRASCSCSTASLKVGVNKSPDFGMAGAAGGWKQAIKSAESGELKVVLDLAHSSMEVGKHTRDIFISSNDPVYPQLTLRVEVEVVP